VQQVLTVTLRNVSSARMILRNVGEHNFHNTGSTFVLAPHSEREVDVQVAGNPDLVDLRLEVLSALIGPERHPVVEGTVQTR